MHPSRAAPARPRRPTWLEAGAERRPWHGRQHLLLVVHGCSLVADHARWVVRRDEERVDVLGRDRQPEVVADEAAPAGDAVPRARLLGQAIDRLQGLCWIPREVRDPDIAAHRDGAAAAVLEGLERRVDAEVCRAGIAVPDARVVRTGQAAVVEGNPHGAGRPGGYRRLELVVRVGVVDLDGRRPGPTAGYRLREHHVELPVVPLLPGHVEVARVGGARGEVL